MRKPTFVGQKAFADNTHSPVVAGNGWQVNKPRLAEPRKGKTRIPSVTIDILIKEYLLPPGFKMRPESELTPAESRLQTELITRARGAYMARKRHETDPVLKAAIAEEIRFACKKADTTGKGRNRKNKK